MGDPFAALMAVLEQRLQRAGVDLHDHRSVWLKVFDLDEWVDKLYSEGVVEVTHEDGTVVNIADLKLAISVWSQYQQNIDNCPEDIRKTLVNKWPWMKRPCP